MLHSIKYFNYGAIWASVAMCCIGGGHLPIAIWVWLVLNTACLGAVIRKEAKDAKPKADR